MLSREDILRKSHYGTRIYSHILRAEYPLDEVVMRIVGRDCGLCRNPYADGRKTLHIWHEKIHPEEKLSLEIARHHDESGTIPDGDCFDFAARYYNLEGQELLQRINEALFLHIGEESRQYARPEPVPPAQPSFSFFRRPVKNIYPEKNITLKEAWLYITGEQAKQNTEALRRITDEKQARAFKAVSFDYACFCGTFSKRSNSDIIEPSGLICLDFDHFADVEAMRQTLLEDDYFDTVLMFTSPSGDGVKWVVEKTDSKMKHEDYFNALAAYLKDAYDLVADANCKDLSRACFLPHDSRAYLAPQFQ